MLIGCIIFNGEPEALFVRALNSLLKVSDRVIAIEGAFREFPEGPFPILEGTSKKLVEALGAEYLFRDGLSEEEKRSCYLVGDSGDRYLVVDADEEYIGDKPNETGVRYVSIHSESGVVPGLRYFCHLPGLHYEATHTTLRWNGGWLMPNKDYSTLKSGFIAHTPELKPPERMVLEGEYMCRLWEMEKDFRREHNL